jgi:hypothetical protein
MEPLLDLPIDQFFGALDELGIDPERRSDLLREYRRRNSAFSPVYGLLDSVAGEDAGEGMERATFAPVSRPAGMSVADAVRSGQAQFAVPQGLLDVVGGVAQAVDAPASAARGLIPADDMTGEALNLAGMAQLGGAAMPAPRGALRSAALGAADDVMETPAQRVARLLREGRADEVTDDLMAQADPQEMFRLYEAGETGADMPLDEASRMARAREMGFDTGTPLYHGTGADFQAFDLDQGWSGSGAQIYGEGVYVSDSPLVSQEYGGTIMPIVRDTTGHQIDWDMPLAGQPPAIQAAVRAEDPTASGMSSGFDLMQRVSGMQATPHNSAADRVATRAAQVLGDYGVTSARFGERMGASNYVVYDPINIRSLFARFDPRLSHLTNLNAANIDPLTGAAAISASQQNDPLANLRAYISAAGGVLGR